MLDGLNAISDEYRLMVKNTFLTIEPHASSGARKRSQSCDTSKHCTSNNVVGTYLSLVIGSPPARSKRLLKASHDLSDVSTAVESRSSLSRSDSNSDRGTLSPDTKTMDYTLGLDSLSDSTVSGDESWVAQEVYEEYVKKTDNQGITLMWHGIPNKWAVHPELLEALDTLGARDVSYVYLPLNYWQKRRSDEASCRNKGYAFVHFMNSEAAEEFAARIASDEICKKPASTSEAACQGVSANLALLMAMPRKRTTTGAIYVRVRDELRPVEKSALWTLTKLRQNELSTM
jgi:hypothetical protein